MISYHLAGIIFSLFTHLSYWYLYPHKICNKIMIIIIIAWLIIALTYSWLRPVVKKEADWQISKVLTAQVYKPGALFRGRDFLLLLHLAKLDWKQTIQRTTVDVNIVKILENVQFLMLMFALWKQNAYWEYSEFQLDQRWYYHYLDASNW